MASADVKTFTDDNFQGEVLGSSEPDRFVATGSVNTAKLPPGDYVLRAVLSVNGQPAGRVFRTFRKD